jgi:hypothetical protein
MVPRLDVEGTRLPADEITDPASIDPYGPRELASATGEVAAPDEDRGLAFGSSLDPCGLDSTTELFEGHRRNLEPVRLEPDSIPPGGQASA